MTTHTQATVLAEFTGALKGNEVALHAIDARRMAAALAEARNEIAKYRECVEIITFSRDVLHQERDDALAELARVRPIVEAARAVVDAESEMHDAHLASQHRGRRHPRTPEGERITVACGRALIRARDALHNAVRAADAEERPDAK